MRNVEDYLEKIPMWASRKNSLESVREFLREMGDPDRSLKIIHVAGTNGKGSVCSYLTSILGQAGFRVTTFVSPHLEHTRERFLVCGEPVSEQIYEAAFGQARQLSETMTAKGYAPPTYFEFLFYMFLAVCSQCQPDFVILETGLGGRLDTTNVIQKPVLTILTSISMDHMQYLGNTIEEIAAEKAGILKKEVPVIYDASSKDSTEIIKHHADIRKSPQFPVTCNDYNLLHWKKEGAQVMIHTLNWGDQKLTVPSQAEYQLLNAAVAVRAVDVLYRLEREQGANPEWITAKHVVKGIEQSYWPGRMEQVLTDVYLDGAHNAGGVAALNQTIRRMQKETKKPVSLLFGAVSDKDHRQMIQNLCDSLDISQITIAHMDTKRSAKCEILASEFQEVLSCPVAVFPTVLQAWHHFIKTKGDGLAFCAGSLYLAGEVKTLLKEEADD